MKYKALLLMACVAALAMLAMPYMTPPADAVLTVTATCNTAGTSVTATWPARVDTATYSIQLSLPTDPPTFVDHKTSQTTSTTFTVQPNTQYAIGVSSQTDSGEVFITCTPPPPSPGTPPPPPPFTASYTCNHGYTATVSWDDVPPGTASFAVFWAGSLSEDGINSAAREITIPIQRDTDFNIEVGARHQDRTILDHVVLHAHCPNHPPTVSAGPDQTVSVNWHIYLSGTVRDDNLDPVTYEWTCGPADLDIAIEGSTSTYAKVILPANYAGTATCTLTATDGHSTSSDTMTITVQSSGGGSTSAQDQTGQDNPPPTDVPDDTPDRTNQGGQSTTRTSGGGGGGSGGFSGFTLTPTPARAPQEPQEPEPYRPAITNGTIPFVKFRSVPLNATHWNGTTTTPFQCDIEPTGHGHVNMTGLTYLGMEPYHIRTSNVTHANATDTTPAVHNMTVHATSTYNGTQIGNHGALLEVLAGNITWAIHPATLADFVRIFDTVDIQAITQYGTVHWAAADGACRAP